MIAIPTLLPPWKGGPRALLGLWRRYRRPPAAPGLPASPADAADAAGEEAPAEERPCGCGWFDSSHDLQQGLRVEEHLSADTLARELPLGAWIDLQLSGWRGAPPVAAQ